MLILAKRNLDVYVITSLIWVNGIILLLKINKFIVNLECVHKIEVVVKQEGRGQGTPFARMT